MKDNAVHRLALVFGKPRIAAAFRVAARTRTANDRSRFWQPSTITQLPVRLHEFLFAAYVDLYHALCCSERKQWRHHRSINLLT